MVADKFKVADWLTVLQGKIRKNYEEGIFLFENDLTNHSVLILYNGTFVGFNQPVNVGFILLFKFVKQQVYVDDKKRIEKSEKITGLLTPHIDLLGKVFLGQVT